MRGERQRTDRDLLRDRWCRWTAILSLFAKKNPDRRRLDPRAYAILRNELIAACGSLAEADGPERLFYADLEQTVDPWLNLSVLEHTDREILSALLRDCREVERKLNGRKWRLALPLNWEPARVAVGGAVIGCVVWLLSMTGGLWVLSTLSDVSNTIWSGIVSADTWQKSSALAVVFVLASIYMVSRTARA
jgi:hypothetical protein